ncbi:MAG: hypothetical protein J6X25_07510 [Bacteroidales bacterium]|nr:hypothetical protein [Bacteroidales bacterium]
MKRFSYLFFIIFLCLFQSCSLNKDEWAKDSNPVGVMYFDGIQLRERGGIRWMHNGFYGELNIIQEGNDFSFLYDPHKLSNKNRSLEAYFPRFIIRGKFEESFDGGTIHYFDGDNKLSSELVIERNGKKEFYLVKEAKVLVSNLVFIRQTDDTHFQANCRIDYTIEATDSLGIKHNVEGWAIPADRDSNRL